jgi:dCMP deaminase
MPRDQLPRIFMEFAVAVSKLSTCARLQVGVVIVDPTLETVLAFGYNGNARGLPNRCDDERALGACGCVHAEINALLKTGRAEKIAFTTDTPCLACAKAMINAGVTEVHAKRPYRLTHGMEAMKQANVPVVMWDVP